VKHSGTHGRGVPPWHGLRLCVLLLLGLAGAGAARADEPVGFAKDIAPLLKSHCAPCHLTGEEPGQMALHPKGAYESLVGTQSTESKLLRVKPGSANDSYMIHKLEGTHLEVGGIGMRMPMEGAPLTADEIAMIRHWIDAGAPDN
jgi:hypothetical protein